MPDSPDPVTPPQSAMPEHGDPAATPEMASPGDGPAQHGHSSSGAQTVVIAGVLLALSGAVLFAAGLSLGGAGVGRDAGEQAAVEAFVETYRQIRDDFVGEAQPGQLLEGAMRGMFETLDDPYSAYLGPDEFATTLADISGEFEGIGARMSVEDGAGSSCPVIDEACALRVIEVLPEAPALAAGLLAGDIVSAVDGRPMAGQTLEDAVGLIRGPRDSDVRLTVDRDGEVLDLSIRRGVIVSQDVRSAVLEDGRIGYLRVDSFSSGSADSFESALRELLEAGLTELVVDVRGDPGGFVDAAVDIASQFIADGPVYWEEDAAGTQRAVEVSGGGLAVDPAIELVVLVDDGTASASEIARGSAPGRRAGRAGRGADFRQGHRPGVDAATRRGRRVPPVRGQVADARQGLGARGRPCAGRRGGHWRPAFLARTGRRRGGPGRGGRGCPTPARHLAPGRRTGVFSRAGGFSEIGAALGIGRSGRAATAHLARHHPSRLRHADGAPRADIRACGARALRVVLRATKGGGVQCKITHVAAPPRRFGSSRARRVWCEPRRRRPSSGRRSCVRLLAGRRRPPT